jgi:mannose/fructose/N-acetylgalactosamine-specific phosphotransferase system component IID
MIPATREAPRPPLALVAAVFFLQAAWNYPRMQALGFAACMAAVTRRVGEGGRDLSRSLHRHLGVFNTNPVLAPWVIGAAARMEEERALRGRPTEAEIVRFKDALAVHLARLGDALVWSAIRPLAAAVGVLLALLGGSYAAAVVYWVSYNAAQVTLRIQGLSAGYRDGLGVTERLPGRGWALATERVRDVGSVAAGAALGLAAADGLAGGSAPALAAVVAAAGVAMVAVDRRRAGATGIALAAVAVAALLAVVGR